jgi:hypothetical protein
MWSPLGPAPGAPPAEDAAAGAARAVPPPMPPAGGGVRKAFICGISYLGSRSQLNGCANDAKCMAYMLQSRFGFREDQVRRDGGAALSTALSPPRPPNTEI